MDDPITAQITREVAGWAGVTVVPHRFGGIEFRVGRRELGHLHGSRLADLPFPVRVRERLVAEQKAQVHHILPESGWVSYVIRDHADVPGAIALFRLNFERPWAG
ncbi:MAG: luciferase family protein [Vicinamibacterales bacterium]